MNLSVLVKFKQDIEKQANIKQDLEQKLAILNAEKSNLQSLKETYPYVLKEAMKCVLQQNNKLRHSLKQLNDDDVQLIR